MGWNTVAVIAEVVVIEGSDGGVFIYDSSGNLVDSMAFLPNVDPQTNSNRPGITSYLGTIIAQLYQGQLNLGLTSDAALAQLTAAAGQLSLTSGKKTAGGTTAAMFMNSSDSSAGLYGFLQAGAAPAQALLLPSGDATGVTDRTAINSLLASGYVVRLTVGTYLTDRPITVPDYGILVCDGRTMAEPAGNYGAGGLALGTGAIIKPVAGFTGSYVIKWGSAGGVQHGGQTVKGITVSCDLLAPATAIGGIQSVGFVAGVTLRDVLLFGAGNASGIGLECNNDGTPGHNPDFWDVSHCKSSGWGGVGIHTVGHADTYWTDVESTGNGGHNWHIENCANSRWLGCKGENSSGGDDWHFQDDSGFAGVLTFTGCTSEQSTSANGRQWTGTGTGIYIFRGCVFPNGTVYPANQTSIVNDDLPPVFDLVTGDFTGVAETIIGTYTIPANYLNQPNAQMRFHLWGRSILANIGDTIQLRLRANGVAGNILADFGSITGTNGTQRFAIDGTIGVDGAGAGGQIDTYAILNSTIVGGSGQLNPASTGSVNVPLNATATIVLTAKMSAAGDEAKTLGGTMILDAAL